MALTEPPSSDQFHVPDAGTSGARVAPGRPNQRWIGAAGVALAALVAGLLAAGAVALADPPTGGDPPTRALLPAGSAEASGGEPAAAVAADGARERAVLEQRLVLEQHLRDAPNDWPSWAALGVLELERGRATQDPEAYATAERALTRSLAIQPRDNADGLAGLAALAAARHDFTGAVRQARAALRVAPQSPPALTALVDALTELGRYDEALATARRLDAVRPGIASFARLSYQAELRGDLARARELMARAAADATSPAQVAFARQHQGLLALEAGDLAGAVRAWRAGSAVSPDDADLYLLGARIAWTQGDRDLALRRYAAAAARRPAPAVVVALADALAAAGRAAEARRSVALVRAVRGLAARSGVAAEATDVLFEADHGDPAAAVRLAAQVWRRAPSVTSADAFGWALLAAGDERTALVMADRALRLGGRSAAMLAHRGLIRASLDAGTDAQAGASADLRAALRGAGALPPSLADRVRTALAGLAGAR